MAGIRDLGREKTKTVDDLIVFRRKSFLKIKGDKQIDRDRSGRNLKENALVETCIRSGGIGGFPLILNDQDWQTLRSLFEGGWQKLLFCQY